MKHNVTILDAINDPKLFAPWFVGKKRKSFENWLTFLSVLFALPLTPDQLKVYTECTGRTVPPTTPFTEVWLCIGRRGGKSFMLALIAVYTCFHDYREYLAPGERGTIVIIAADRKQARTIFRYVKGFLNGVPMLARMIERETAESFDLNNSISIEIHAASFRSSRGYTLVAALCDEAAFWRSEESANPDREILAALRPAMATIPGATLLVASSPYASRGAMWDAYRRHYAKDSPVLFWKAPTRTMNPLVPQSFIDAAYEEDASSANAEFGAEFRTDLESFISREVVDAAVCNGRYELSRMDGAAYIAFVDPQGGGKDSFAMAIAHMEGDRAVLDLVRECKSSEAGFSPDTVVKEFSDVIKSYGIASCYGDNYAGTWPRDRFAQHGVDYQKVGKAKSVIYGELLPMLNSKRVELLDLPRLVSQLCALERHTGRTKDNIDHPKGAHDDVINAAAGAVVYASQRAARAVPIVAPILVSGGPRNFPGSDTAATSQSYSEPATTNATTAYFEWIANGGDRGWGPV